MPCRINASTFPSVCSVVFLEHKGNARQIHRRSVAGSRLVLAAALLDQSHAAPLQLCVGDGYFFMIVVSGKCHAAGRRQSVIGYRIFKCSAALQLIAVCIRFYDIIIDADFKRLERKTSLRLQGFNMHRTVLLAVRVVINPILVRIQTINRYIELILRCCRIAILIVYNFLYGKRCGLIVVHKYIGSRNMGNALTPRNTVVVYFRLFVFDFHGIGTVGFHISVDKQFNITNRIRRVLHADRLVRRNDFLDRVHIGRCSKLLSVILRLIACTRIRQHGNRAERACPILFRKRNRLVGVRTLAHRARRHRSRISDAGIC